MQRRGRESTTEPADAATSLNDADTGAPTDSGGGDSATATKKAKATLAATGLPDSGTPSGSIEIEADGTQATVKISVSGATNGYHGVHIHAAGDCANNDAGYAGAAGGHWNPTDAGHGFPSSGNHHAGDPVTLSRPARERVNDDDDDAGRRKTC
jgi:Cu-Zn family superoxide dismutase